MLFATQGYMALIYINIPAFYIIFDLSKYIQRGIIVFLAELLALWRKK